MAQFFLSHSVYVKLHCNNEQLCETGTAADSTHDVVNCHITVTSAGTPEALSNEMTQLSFVILVTVYQQGVAKN